MNAMSSALGDQRGKRSSRSVSVNRNTEDPSLLAAYISRFPSRLDMKAIRSVGSGTSVVVAVLVEVVVAVVAVVAVVVVIVGAAVVVVEVVVVVVAEVVEGAVDVVAGLVVEATSPPPQDAVSRAAIPVRMTSLRPYPTVQR